MGSPAKPRLLIFIVAYFAERTIDKVIRRIPKSLLDVYDAEILVIDDGSADATFLRSVQSGRDPDLPFKLTVLFNPVNQGYGGNQKIGYHYAIRMGFDFVALVHGDGQYAPEILPDLVEPLRLKQADAVFGSRMMNPRDALKGGMPYYKFVGNRILTAFQNRILNSNLTEFHSGYRVYAVETLKALPFDRNTNDFHFDTEIIVQLMIAGRTIVEKPIPTYYGDEICYVNGLQYAGNVMKASLQAKFQKANLFYDRRFDCEPVDPGEKYPSKLEFDSTHSRIVELVPAGSSVLDFGSGIGAVGAALKQKGCHVVGCDIEGGPLTAQFDKFVTANLDEGLPDFAGEKFDYILLLDVIEHLRSPEDFLDQLRKVAAASGAEVILTTANIGFIVMRLSLMLGRFEYGKRGILDLTHTRLFTFATMRRALAAAGFDVTASEGIVLPLPLVLGNSRLAKALIRINRFLVRLWPTMFGFQILLRATARLTLDQLLSDARLAADEKLPAALQQIGNAA
jgi:glycosyltransferase involved in cell wall biosynthesis